MIKNETLEKYGFGNNDSLLREYVNGTRRVKLNKGTDKEESYNITDLLNSKNARVISLDNTFIKDVKIEDIAGDRYFKDACGRWIKLSNVTDIKKSTANRPQQLGSVWNNIYDVYVEHPSKMGNKLVCRVAFTN